MISLVVSACCQLLIKLSTAINAEETQHLKFREQNPGQSRAEGGHPLYAGVWGARRAPSLLDRWSRNKQAATRRVTGLYLSTATDKARQGPWRRPPGSKAARQAGIGWSPPLGGGLGALRAPMVVIVTGQ